MTNTEGRKISQPQITAEYIYIIEDKEVKMIAFHDDFLIKLLTIMFE
jgi:hypothetical protein